MSKLKRTPATEYQAAAYNMLATLGAYEFWYTELENEEWGIGVNPHDGGVIIKVASEDAAMGIVFLLSQGLKTFRREMAWQGYFLDRPTLPDGSPSTE